MDVVSNKNSNSNNNKKVNEKLFGRYTFGTYKFICMCTAYVYIVWG